MNACLPSIKNSGINLAIVLISLIIACNSDWYQKGNHLPQRMVDLAYSDWSTPRYNEADVDQCKQPFDTDSIEMFNYRGGDYYHPVYMMNRSKQFVDAFLVTGDSAYLSRAVKYIAKLESLAQPYQNALFLPYPFRFAVHSDSANLFTPPWYSGMAQGACLSVTMRLYTLTHNEHYLEFGRKIFNAYLIEPSSGNPWVSRLDSDGYYWIEEYPHNVRPGMTLNGYISGIEGIYEYYQQTRDPRAKWIFELCITTIKQYLPYYRIEGKKSYYCLGHKAESRAYHFLHIQQMMGLSQFTNDPFFSMMSQILKYDSDQEALDSAGAK